MHAIRAKRCQIPDATVTPAELAAHNAQTSPHHRQIPDATVR